MSETGWSEPGGECGPPVGHRASDLQCIFDRLFYLPYRTRLIGGADEPLYLPAAASSQCHRLYFTRDYFASALHEVAHWCIAGEGRRQQLDYGYWYLPDGRDAAGQRAFEQVEAMPQALEWIFSRACGYRFHLSADNLHGDAGVDAVFGDAVTRELQRYCSRGLPLRAGQFRAALCQFYCTPAQLRVGDFDGVGEGAELPA